MGKDRRQFLRRAGTGVAVVAFVPCSRLWSADPAPVGAVAVPPLDGELILAGSVLDASADDFGHLVSRQPYAVLRPGSVEDVAKMVRFVREQGLHIAGMGAVGDSHSTFGQAQVAAGVVIDMATLRSIGPVGPDGVWVEAGASWLEVLEATLPSGLSPPTLTDYLGLRVGGTLSVGGIGGQAFRHGLQGGVTLLGVVPCRAAEGRSRRSIRGPERSARSSRVGCLPHGSRSG